MPMYIVDENVPIVRNDSSRKKPKAPQADETCRRACIRALKSVVRSGILIVDADGVVLAKYRRHLQHKGQPGVGDAFFKHVADNQFNPRKVARVNLQQNADRVFEDFPADASLAAFDRSDRVFVALALASARDPAL
jgi:hypothetical protein